MYACECLSAHLHEELHDAYTNSFVHPSPCTGLGTNLFRSQLSCGSADDDGCMRLGVLAASNEANDGAVVRLGHEILINGTQTIFDQHVARAQQYADQYACTVYVVNVMFTDGSCAKGVQLPSPDPKV